MGVRCQLHAISDAQLLANEILETLDLDKDWHGLHYIVSGAAATSSEPQHFIRSGELVEGPDEHIAIQRHMAVAAFAAYLATQTGEMLQARYQPDIMNEQDIYGGPWSSTRLTELLDAFRHLRNFIEDHAAKGHAILIVIA